MKKTAWGLGLISALAGGLLFTRLKAPKGLLLLGPKLLAGALAPFLAVTGAVAAWLGAFSRAPGAVLAGLFGLAAAARYTSRAVAAPADFEQAFGAGWRARISPQQEAGMLPRRWTWRAPQPAGVRFVRDVLFWTVAENRRDLLCDLWLPPEVTSMSGIALIYFHGSAWSMGDKDLGTRWFFRHLANQGHVVMDVAYRLHPQVGIPDMVGDVQRAVAWMKTNAARLGSRPDRIVLMGGSAGGHLALLAGYAPGLGAFTPDELRGVDTSVHGVVSYYGPVDLQFSARQGWRELRVAEKPGATGQAPLLSKIFTPVFDRVLLGQQVGVMLGNLSKLGSRDLLENLMGGSIDKIPEVYDLLSPITHIHPGCPPTLLLQGEHDLLVPVETTRKFYRQLLAAGVKAVYIEFPQTDHAFDLVLPQFSPASQTALYYVERFLALIQ
jgi:acetyl esterase/lipase